MDWAKAIERNSQALKAIVAALFAMLGVTAEARLPRPLHRAILNVLLPAESATRRLIVIAARGLAVKPFPSRPMPQAPIGRGGRNRLAFRLVDPRKRFAPNSPSTGPRVTPRIHIFGGDPRVSALWPSPDRSAAPAPPHDDGRIDASRLTSRLQALKLALGDLPRQARRLVRLRARRDKASGSRFKSPLRPGYPPGHRRMPVHDVDRVLAECHGLAHDAMRLDTS
ncbi:MAG: hypothetical protein ACREDX_11725 [Aestuariivirga sp.]